MVNTVNIKMVYLQEMASDSSQVKKPKNFHKYHNTNSDSLVDSLSRTLAYSKEDYLVSTAISALTPPLDSDYSFSPSKGDFNCQLDNLPVDQLLGDLPDSPDSNSTNAKKYRINSADESVNSKLNNIATHSQLHSSHRFHPFQSNGSNIGGGSDHSSCSQGDDPNTGGQSSSDQMPETDCYFPGATTNMLDYHLNSAYMGELSSTKCDYQVNGYASNYYSSMQTYPLNTHSNAGQQNATLSGIPNAASFYNSFYNNGMLGQGYHMTGAYNNFTNSSLGNTATNPTNHLLQPTAANESQQAGSLDENVQLYHNGLASNALIGEDYVAANYSNQLGAQQAVPPQYSGTGNGETNTSTQHSGHSLGDHVHSNSAHTLLATTSTQSPAPLHQQRSAHHSNQLTSNYYYSHLHPQSHQASSSSTTRSTSGTSVHNNLQRSTNQQATAASLLHQHQPSNYHLQQNTHDNQLQNLSTAGTTCSTTTNESNTLPVQHLNSNNSSNSINNSSNLTNRTNSTAAATASNGSNQANNKNSNDKTKLIKIDPETAKSLPSSPVANRSSPNATQSQASPNVSMNLQTNSSTEMTKGYPNTASVLIEGLTELDLVNSQHMNHCQQSISPLIVVNCNNSLSSNNSNCTDDTAVTYQYPNNSITLTDLSVHPQSHAMIGSPKCSPNNSGEMHSGFKKMKTGRGRSKKQSSPVPDTAYERIYIWDLDETLIILDSLLNGTYANNFQKEPQTADLLGKKMENIVYNVARKHFLLNNFDDCTQYHIDEITLEENEQNLMLNPNEYNERNPLNPAMNPTLNRTGNIECMNNLQVYVQQVKKSYLNYRNNFEALIDQCGMPNSTNENWSQLKVEINRFTDGWISYGQQSLEIIAQRPKSLNLLVADAQLSVILSKVLAFGLGPLFPIENIYSSSKIGKEQCFQRILDRYGKKNTTYIVVGDGKEEEVAANSLRMIFWRINNLSAIANFVLALQNWLY